MARKHKGKISLLANDIKPVVRQIGRRQRNVHPEIWARWIEILGKELAKRAVPKAWKGRTLYIAVASSAWMQELAYLKPALLDKFEAAVGPKVVREIRLVLDPSIPRYDAKTKRSESNSKPREESEPLPENIVQMVESISDESVRSAVLRALETSWKDGS